jgi:hypothetical protein
MMMKYVILANLTLIFLISCSDKKTSFETLIEKIDTISLPFFDTCGKDLDCLKFVGNDTAISQYLPSASISAFKLRVIGKLQQRRQYIMLLLADTYADCQLHYIVTFSNNGEVISKFALYRISGLTNEEYFGEAQCSISKDLVINLRDSTVEYNDSGKKFISNSPNDLFRIADNGSIVKK